MRSDRNHEGYQDPTAAQAILRASVGQDDEKGQTYRLKEAKGFQEAEEVLRGGRQIVEILKLLAIAAGVLAGLQIAKYLDKK